MSTNQENDSLNAFDRYRIFHMAVTLHSGQLNFRFKGDFIREVGKRNFGFRIADLKFGLVLPS
jgi:hypothetical protein